MRLFPVLLTLAACSETGVVHEYPIPQLEFVLDRPTYGEFVGDGPIVVEGRTGSEYSTVYVEGVAVPVADDGTFSVALPIDGPYAIVDVSADLFEASAEARVPVFRGYDPLETWPGGIAARLTPSGLDGLAAVIEPTIAEALNPEALLQGLPQTTGDGFSFEILDITADPLDLQLQPAEEAIEAAVRLTNIQLDAVATVVVLDFPLEVPLTVTIDEVLIGLGIVAGLGPNDDIQISLGEPVLDVAEPEFEVFDLDLSFVTDLIRQFVDLGDLLNGAIAPLFDGIEPFSLGDALAFETDLLGTSFALRLAEVVTDQDGVGLGLGVGLDGPAPEGGVTVPWPKGDFEEPADLAIAVHEGLLQLLLDTDLLALLEQDIQLPGFIGELLGNTIRSLPGGSQAPSGTNGWCLSLQPGEAKVARGQEGTEPLIEIYLPDATVDIGYLEAGSSVCQEWLVASLALEVGLELEGGTSLSFGIDAPDGKVLSYGATGVESDEVVARLGGVLTSLLDLVGGFAQFDLADVLGGGLGDLGGLGGLGGDGLSFEIRGSRQMYDENGEPIEGLFELGVGLF